MARLASAAVYVTDARIISCWYLPQWYLAAVGKWLDSRQKSFKPSHIALRNLKKGSGRDDDWEQFYEIQSSAWGLLSGAGLGVAFITILIASITTGFTSAWGVLFVVDMATCAACFSFESIIQAHVVARSWGGFGGKLLLPVVRYFEYPRIWDLTIVPLSFLFCLALTLPAVDTV